MGSKWIALIIAAMMLSALGLSSCTAEPSSPTESVTSIASTKPYGSVTIAPNFYAGTFSAITSVTGLGLYSGSTYDTLVACVFDKLIEQTPDAKPKPGLAERWEISPDGMTQTFYIRKGVKFHDGSDLSGADVQFSLENKRVNATSGDWKNALDKIELKNDYTVVLRLKQPRFDLLTGLDDGSGTGAIVPKRYVEEKGWEYFGLNPVGSGPWKVVKWEVNNRLELEAVEDHWLATPKFKNVTLVNVKEEGSKVAMLKTGELDIAEVSPDSVAGLKAAGFRILRHYTGAQWYFAPLWDWERPTDHPIGDVRVRKAMSLAVNRQEVADKLAGGYGQPAALYPISKYADFFGPKELKPDAFDPEGAKKLLVEAGYPNGFDTKFWDTGGGGVLSNFFLGLTGYWRKIGINARLESVEWSALIRKVTSMVPRPPDVVGTVWGTAGGGHGKGDFSLVERYVWPGGTTRNPDPRLNELLNKVPLTQDRGERERLAFEAILLAKEGYSGVAVVDIDAIFAYGPKVGEMAPIPGNWGLAATLDTIAHAK